VASSTVMVGPRNHSSSVCLTQCLHHIV
jgi:hypothetical protein